MISLEIKEFMKNAPVSFVMGTRDAALQPSAARVFSAEPDQDGSHITFSLPKISSGKHLANLQDNGQIALTICAVDSYITYQFKGQYVAHQDGDSETTSLAQNRTDLMGKRLIEIGMHSEAVEGFLSYDLASMHEITMKVTEIFDQTPKPGAGNKIK